MTDLGQKLEELGLSQYLDAFVAEGFDNWATVLDISEPDLSLLNVKLGHRRKLQRAIEKTRAHAASDIQQLNAPSGQQARRQYRRHPKPDINAPKRPLSAYALFANHIFEELKGQDLPFTEKAKFVGEQWQLHRPEFRAVCQRQASVTSETYHAELASHKKTQEYAWYQEYLADFKERHPRKKTEKEQPKLKLETSLLTPRSVQPDHRSKEARRQFPKDSDAGSERHPPYYSASDSTPLERGQQSGTTSPVTNPSLDFNGPKWQEQSSSISAIISSQRSGENGAHEGAVLENSSAQKPYDRDAVHALSTSGKRAYNSFHALPKEDLMTSWKGTYQAVPRQNNLRHDNISPSAEAPEQYAHRVLPPPIQSTRAVYQELQPVPSASSPEVLTPPSPFSTQSAAE